MVAVLTADIVNSARTPAGRWLEPLKAYLNTRGSSPEDWEIYRGDEMQLRLAPQSALSCAVRLKALLKSMPDSLDIRIGIGLGEEDYRAERVSESNGTAFRNSGRSFEALGNDKIRMCLTSGNPGADRAMNLILKLALNIMDGWSRLSAESVIQALDRPDAPQEALARELGIRQSAFSQRLARARYDLIQDLLAYYEQVYLQQL